LDLLSKILGALNVTEIARGKMPGLTKEGLAYRSLSIEGELQDGDLLLKEAVLHGSSMDLVYHGNVKLELDAVDWTGGAVF